MKPLKWDKTLPEKGRKAALVASDAEKEEALKHATDFLGTLPWKGTKLTEVQALDWPRKGVYRKDGTPVEGVPQEIRDACMMVAGFILAKIPFNAISLAHVFAVAGDFIDETEDYQTPQRVTWH